ncbi:GNAT family N-acetyltransferase [Alteromonas ponticola]|uniref:GNAT family N-acetyltransferase n=1 Tax=Alteromonas aquimaris TaxID=2998417 RepID=A0ABT3P6B1_9ALTE|nr:GNAT family N-acetyltransferase [Alteromonas aquimaris]MCW8108310.1 GNAT family N-acetyltransferase [Alteromonas aquimaris]
MSTIRKISAPDIAKITDIYNYYVENTVFTFEERPVSKTAIQQRVDRVSSLKLPWLVLESEFQVMGYAYATQWKARSAYRFTVEVTIYLSPDQQGKGYGKALYQELFRQLSSTATRSCIAVITLPNEASISLHEKMGMRKVAHFEGVGFKFGSWQDVGYWQAQLPNSH